MGDPTIELWAIAIARRIAREALPVSYGANMRRQRQIALIVQEECARAPAPIVADRLFEAKLLGFPNDGDRIRLCEPCLRRATDDNFVIFASALPLSAPAATVAPQQSASCWHCGTPMEAVEFKPRCDSDSELMAPASPAAPARTVQHLVNQWQAAWLPTQDISRDSEADLVRRIEAFISPAALRDEAEISIEQAAAVVFQRYGVNLAAFWQDAFAIEAQKHGRDEVEQYGVDGNCIHCIPICRRCQLTIIEFHLKETDAIRAAQNETALPWVNYVETARQIADSYKEQPDAAIAELRKLVEYVAVAVRAGHLDRIATTTPPSTLAKAAAEEIADRWARRDIPLKAAIYSNPRVQLQELAMYVIERYLAGGSE